MVIISLYQLSTYKPCTWYAELQELRERFLKLYVSNYICERYRDRWESTTDQLLDMFGRDAAGDIFDYLGPYEHHYFCVPFEFLVFCIFFESNSHQTRVRKADAVKITT